MIGIAPSELAKRVLHRVENEPETCNQRVWVNWPRPGGGTGIGTDVDDCRRALEAIRSGECGTIACVAGWTVIEALDMGCDEVFDFMHIDLAASRLLGVKPMLQALGDDEHLFSEHNSRADLCRMLRELIEGG